MEMFINLDSFFPSKPPRQNDRTHVVSDFVADVKYESLDVSARRLGLKFV